MMWKVALAACVAVLVMLFVVNGMYGNIQELKQEAKQLEVEVKTHERIRDADVGSGDVDADTLWLCKRAGKSDCGP